MGGEDAEPGDYPWQIALFKEQGQFLIFRCGGTLIADTTVVTAAHCTEGLQDDKLSVLVGSHLLSTGGTVIPVATATEHPDFNSGTLQNDAALLQLSGSGISAGGEPLQLIGAEGSADDTFWAAGDTLAISGWGSTSSGGGSVNELREGRVPRVADSTCGQNDWYGSDFDPATMVCAGFAAGGVDTCQGDSGGPLVATTQNSLPLSEDDPSEWRLVGITSWGEGCAQAKKPGVYTRVAAPAIRNFVLGSPPPPPTQHTLTVSKGGTGAGTVTGSGINCGSDCSQDYDEGTDVTLTASAAAGSTFAGWTGACTGTGQCVVSMDGDRSVTATFNTSPPPTQHTLTVTKSGTGSGTVSGGGINCGTNCSQDTQDYDEGTDVTLTASAAAGSTFAGWTGACSGTNPCVISMDGDRSVTATFNEQASPPPPPPPTTHTLTVAKSGTGAGTVTSSPSGISCGSDCSQGYTVGTDVTLTASAASGSTFSGWSGACSGTGPCNVSMDGARSVTATFNVQQSSPDPEPDPEPEPDPTPDPADSEQPPDTTPPDAAVATKPLVMSRRGVVRLGVDCSDSPEDCFGNARLRLRVPGDASAAALRTVARASFEIAAGESKRVKLRLRRKARRLVQREGRVRVRVIVVVEDDAGNTRTIRKRLTLRAAE